MKPKYNFGFILLGVLFYAGLHWLIGPPPNKANARTDLSNVASIMRLKAGTADNGPNGDWQTYLPKKQRYIQDNIGKLRGKTVHVVLQVHDDPINPMTIDEILQVDAFQAKVATILVDLQPKLLVIEGLFTDELTSDDWGEILKSWHRYASAQYASKNPDCIAIGMEPDVIGKQDIEFLRQGEYELFWAIVRFRSYYGLARLGAKMEKYKLYKDAVIVIGAAHRGEFELAASQYDINVVFHDASQLD